MNIGKNMNLDKDKSNFDDLFSEINHQNINPKEDEPSFIKDQRKKSFDLKETLGGFVSTIKDGIDLFYELKNKEYIISQEHSSEILKIIRKEKEEKKSRNYTALLFFIINFCALVFGMANPVGIMFIITFLGINFLFLIYELYIINKRDIKESTEIKEELEKIPVVFKNNKINFNMLLFSAFKRENNEKFNLALKEQIENVLKKEVWINLDEDKINRKQLREKLEEVERKMSSFK